MSMMLIFVFLAGAILLFSAINVLKEYERGVVFTLGRFWKVKGPGLIIVIPIINSFHSFTSEYTIIEFVAIYKTI